jgi:hypothetical protein
MAQSSPASSRSTNQGRNPALTAPAQGLEFLENKGQVRDDQGRPVERVRFTAHSNGAKLFFMPDRIAHVFVRTDYKEPDDPFASSPEHAREHILDYRESRYTLERIDLELVGANQNVNLRAEGLLPGVTNFFTAATGPDGITGVRSFSTIVYENVYPNIDLVLKARGKGMKAEFIVRPGGDPTMIRLRYTGAERIEATSDGGYRVVTALGTMTEDAPYSFVRTADGTEQEVAARFRVEGDAVTFDVPAYDRSQTLVIDPNREWGTYHGGSALDVITSVAVQPTFNPAANDAYVFVCGYTVSSDMPTTAGVSQTSNGGNEDAFVAAYRYGPSTTRYYSTYYGGSANDRAYGIAANSSGQVWIVGQTAGTLPGASGTPAGNIDGFVAFVNANGTSISPARYLGGNLNDFLRSVAISTVSGYIFVGGYTVSSGLGTTGTFQPNKEGTICGIVARLNSSSLATDWLTYYGNNIGATNTYETYVFSVAPAPSGGVWVGGHTNSENSNQAIATTGSFNTAINNNSGSTAFYDGFVALLTSAGQRTASTYYGAERHDYIRAVANDPAGGVIAAGFTNSSNTGGIIANANAFSTTLNNNSLNTTDYDGMVVRLTVSGTTMNRAWGSYWGGDGDEAIYAVAVDDNNVTESVSNTISAGRGLKIYVTGSTNLSGGSYSSYNVDGSYTTNNGGYDVFWSRIFRGTTDNPTVEYTAIFGSTGNDYGYGIAVDNQRNVFVAGGVGSSSTGSGAGVQQGTVPQATYGGGSSDGFLNKWCDLIRPNAPEFSTNGGSSFSPSANVCESLNSTATGFVTSPGAYPNVASGTTSGSCQSIAVQTLTVRLTNAVQGVQYRLQVATGPGSPFFLNIGPVSGVNSVDGQTVVATTDGEIRVSVGPPSAGAYTLRWIAYTQTVPSSCSESGVTSGTLNVNPLPTNNAISQTAPGTDNNSAAAPGSTFNFYVCGGTANNFSVIPAAGLIYNWCVLQNGSVTAPPTVSGANTQTVSIIPGTGPAQRDTLYLRVRLENSNNCAIEYQAALYVLPVVSITNGTANEAANANANPTALCVNSSGTVTAPTTYSYQDSGPHTLADTYGNASNPGNGATGSDNVTAVTQAYAWTTNAPQGAINSVSFSSASNANGGTVSVTYGGGGFSSMANPQSVQFTLTESYTVGGIAGCSRQANYTVNFYPQPTVAVTPSPAGPVCEGTNVTFTIAVTPSSVTSGSISLTLNAGSQTGASVIGSTGLNPAWSGSATTYSGQFNSSTITVTVNPGTVTAPYDALGSISLTVNSLTNGVLRHFPVAYRAQSQARRSPLPSSPIS